MSDLAQVLARISSDPGFADAVRERPSVALRGYDLDDADLRRVEAVISGSISFDELLGSSRTPSRRRGDGRPRPQV
jgi:hypothetical protein